MRLAELFGLPAMPRSSRTASSSRSSAPLQAGGDHAIPGRRLAAGALAQHLGVVDLAQLHVAAGHRRPHAGDAAVGAHRFRRSAEQQQERAPGVDVAAGMDRHLADEVAVQQRRELGERRIRSRRRAAVEQSRIRQEARSATSRTRQVPGDVRCTMRPSVARWPDARRDKARRRVPPPCRRARTRSAAWCLRGSAVEAPSLGQRCRTSSTMPSGDPGPQPHILPAECERSTSS